MHEHDALSLLLKAAFPRESADDLPASFRSDVLRRACRPERPRLPVTVLILLTAGLAVACVSLFAVAPADLTALLAEIRKWLDGTARAISPR